MKPTLILPLALALASSAFSQVVYYSDVSIDLPGSSGQTVTETTLLSLDPDHRFIDPNAGDATIARYYGGTLTYTGGSEWGGSGQIFVTNQDAPNTNISLRLGSGSTSWQFMNNNTGVATASIDFVIKIEDASWNVAVVKLYLGANATGLTEGVPDLTLNNVSSAHVNDLVLTSLSFRLSGESWEVAPQSLTAQNLFSSTAWNPVGAAIPEPASFAALGGLVAVGFAACRRRRRDVA